MLDDARGDDPPTATIVLTTWRRLSKRELKQARASLWRRARQELGRVEVVWWLHLTAGGSVVPGRPHIHALVKAESACVDDLQRVVKGEWKRSTGATQVEVSALRREDVAAAAVYASKGAEGGMRASHGYFSRPIGVLREEERQERRRAVTSGVVRKRVTSALKASPAGPVKDVFANAIVRELIDSELTREWRCCKASLRDSAR